MYTHARARVQDWLNAVTSREDFRKERPLHETFDGEQLWAEDIQLLIDLCRKTQPPRMAEPSKRLKTRDPATSFAAALSNSTETAAQLYRAIYSMLFYNRYGLTDEEMLDRLEHDVAFSVPPTPSGVRTRRSEMEKAGWVCAAGTRATKTGRSSTVWKLVPVATAFIA